METEIDISDNLLGNTETVRRKQATLEALKVARGVVGTAAKSAGISRETFYNWRKNDPVFAMLALEQKESAIDFAESKLFELIKEKFFPAIKYYLSTQAKSRGYNETFTILTAEQLQNLNDAELQQYINGEPVNATPKTLH